MLMEYMPFLPAPTRLPWRLAYGWRVWRFQDRVLLGPRRTLGDSPSITLSRCEFAHCKPVTTLQ
jgi:hypothetical protein